MIGNNQNIGAKTRGFKPFTLISANSANITLVKNSAGNLGSIIAVGLTNNVRYLNFYDSNSNNESVLNILTPKLIYPIPTNIQGAGFTISFPKEIYFENGIVFTITSIVANTKSPVNANDVIVNLSYE